MSAAVLAPRRTPVWRWVRPGLAAATLAFLVWRLGTGPFLDGLRTISAPALAAGAALAVPTTVCCAWRWRAVAGGLGQELRLTTAVAAYYRSLFLNVTLPGGVLGDVDRGLGHGFGAVVLERSAGQVVQIVLTVAVLLVVPSPVHAAMPFVALGVAAVAAAVVVSRAAWRNARALRAFTAWPVIALASALVVIGHAVTFLIAARTAGAAASMTELLAIALIVLAAAALPNVGGWGPREGVTAWAFSAAGLGAARGVTAAVVYGVMVIVATLPGAAILLLGRRRA